MAAGILKNLSNRTKNIILGVTLLVLVATAIGLSLTTYSVATGKISFIVRDITTASDSCEQEVISQFGNRIVYKEYDHGSSSYDDIRRSYRIWYRFSVKDNNERGIPEIRDYMIQCEVSEFLGYVSRFEVYDM